MRHKTISLVLSAVIGLGGIAASTSYAQTQGGTGKTGTGHTEERLVFIDAQHLKSLLDSKAPVTLVDARSAKWDDGRRLPGAILLPADSSEADITKALPNKDVAIVTYCASTSCPAGKKLAEKLLNMGYTNVKEYSGGIKEWADEKKFPIENTKKK